MKHKEHHRGVPIIKGKKDGSNHVGLYSNTKARQAAKGHVQECIAHGLPEDLSNINLQPTILNNLVN